MATAFIQKWGNGLALRIPEMLAKQAGLREGSAVHVTATHQAIVVRRAVPKYSLKELVDKITPENVHTATDFAGPVGKELW